MELRERLGQSAVWLEAHFEQSLEHRRVAAALRDAMEEIAALEALRMENSKRLDNYEKTNVELLRQLEDLREKLLIAETAAKDEASFRKRDQQTAQHITLGMTIAIEAMVTGLKKGGA